MKKITLSSVLFLLIVQLSFSQSIVSKRISITNPTQSQLLKVKDAGIDLSCGAIFKDNTLILELGASELKALNQNNIAYSVIIDDLIGYYKNRNATELPIAKAQLEAKKSQSKTASKSLSTKSESIDNFIQYEGCSEVNWAVPTNFNLGSMGGCLTYSEMLTELDEMRALYPNLISVKTDASPGTVTHGNSYTNGGAYDTWAGQPIYYVRISDNPDVDEANEPESLYSGMTHSREVSSMMNLIYYMWYVLENYNSDAGIKNLVDNHEMYFIPVANPDGLMWNEQIAPSGGGMQRKNLGPYNTGNNVLRGVDLNRNYDYFWGSNPIYGGSSSTQSSNTYRGPNAFSEPETQIVRNFSATREFKTAMNHHATSNLIPHAYNGYPGAPPSGREAEYHKFCHDMTRFNRYIYGEAPDILTIANGDMSDWMLGGVADVNGSTGSGKAILALAPENGAWDGSEGGFWPNATQIVNIAERAVRMNFVNAYHSGKFAQFHDLNPSDISATSGNLEFGLEYLGQTLGDITLNVTPVSANITSIIPPVTQTGWSKLEQRTLTAAYTLDAGILPNDEIEFQVTLSNDDGYVMYRANIIKAYNPTVLFTDNPDTDNLTNWSASGGSWGTVTTTDYNGNSTTAITDSPSGAYNNNQSNTLTLNSGVNLSGSSAAIIQFFAKWDLERNFDYVQIEGSTNGSTWTPLCGKYTKPGSDATTNRYSSGNSSNTTDPNRTNTTNQPSGESLYDADTMDKWVMEEILIDATENSFLLGATNAQFRFVFDSDNTNRADGYPTTFDGFIFDDFKIISIDVPCVTTVPNGVTTSNITTVSATINWDNIPSANYDLRYKETSSSTWIDVNGLSEATTNLTGLTAATNYEVQVRSNCGSGSNSAYSSSVNFATLDDLGCTGGISNYPYAESFENTLGDWTQSTNDDQNWTIDASGTPSANTGPSSAIEGSYYIYVEASGNNTGYPNKRSIINSPCFDLSGLSEATFSFNYHMYGATDMGTIDLEASIDDGVTWSSIWNQSGNQGNSWFSVDVDLTAYTGSSVQLRFNRFVGSTWQADIAIDNIKLSGVEGQDTTAPVITLTGASTINLNIGDVYTEQGATANDNIDGDITANIIIGGDTVDANTAGTYTVTYNVSDAAGNAATTVTRTVNVVPDTTAPVITLTGASTINLNIGDAYTEEGATANDNIDGDITANIVIGGNIVDGNTAGTYVVTYNVSDAAGNAATTVTRTVNVVPDTTAPVITLTGASTINLNVGDAYTEEGATANDNKDGDITANIVIGGDAVDTNTAGAYVITYNVSDAAGNAATTITRTVNVVPDTTAPVITLTGASTINLNIGDAYTEEGATANDNIDGDITANIVIGGNIVDGNTAGTYVVTYNVSDAAGNAATTVTRTVNVVPDTTAPVITLTGASTINLNVGDTYTEQGATANDNIDGDITANIVIGGDTVDANTAGTYAVTYNVSDAAGNAATTVTRIIIVTSIPTTVVLHEGYFESGWDGWSDGGSDCARQADALRSYEGNYSIRIRDNSGIASSMTSPSFDLSPYNEVEFSFYFYANSMENNEDFWLQYNDGSGFTTIATWARGTNFNNGSFENRVVTLNASNYNLVSNGQFRLRCDASGNNDHIFIDQVVITGNGSNNAARNIITKIANAPEEQIIVENKNNFKLYPNPVKDGVLNIILSKNASNMSYRIINMLGQVVNQGITTKEIIVDNLEAGVYYIEVNDGKEKMTKRFVKE